MRIYWICFLLLCASCNRVERTSNKSLRDDIAQQIIDSPVSCVKATKGRLLLKKYVQGKITAFGRVEVKFENSGRIVSSNLKSGQSVKQDHILAQLDDQDAQYELSNKYIDLEIAQNERKERMMLVSGGLYGDSSVTNKQLDYINIVSGYNKALQAIKEAKYRLTKRTLLSPFNGIVADLKAKKDQYVSTGEVLCTLIDPYSFEATFAVTEDIAMDLKMNQSIEVISSARSDLSVSARISAINPLVDKHGLVKIYARLQTDHHKFFEGMNVLLAIEQITPSSIIVPKAAVVLRSNRDVIFTYEERNGLAKWNYVTVSYENDDSLGITEGLKAGELVIVEGNSNLDHDSKVILALQDKSQDDS